ncbi:hypothetical protein K3152_10440 [Qipengyuania sp. 1NDH17]|uniref:PAS domain-containing protein n=1 Tax=Qipengyuania polymorpha TaxID=2867234 RepID=A0ABS7IYM3_9SPHN|nr:hypothetical protein [Qipengyuania polymorpha]MBX7458662.1 hypothetical protein [Qipengyuania polymorpha]
MDRLGGDFGAFGAGQEFDDASDDSAYDANTDTGAHSNPPPSPVGQDERRMQVRAYNHWSSLLGEQDLPHIEDLEPEFLGDFGPYSVLFDFSTGSGTPTLQFIGDELAKECREAEPIETLQEIPEGSLLSKIAENYLRVVQAQGPVTFEAESPNARGQTVAYRGVLLPYSSDHDTIDFVYAVVNWKEVADAQTADALLEEIDRAMDYSMTAIEPEVEAEPAPTADIVHFESYAQPEEVEEVADEAAFDEAGDHWESDDNILELRGSALNEAGAFGDLPTPSFGQSDDEANEDAAAEDEFEANDPAIYEAVHSQPEEAVTEDYNSTPYEAAPQDAAPKRQRLTDALGNPIGGAPAAEEDEAPAPGGITTAADYGLPEWDEDEPEEEDVDDLVNPLANIDLNSRLLSLVNAGTRGKKTVDLATLSDTPEPEEAEEADASKLFRPKAPSVDSLLSPEPYSEEDEAEACDEDSYEPASYEQPAEVEPVAEADNSYEPVSEAAYDYAPEISEEPAYEEVEPVEVAAEAETYEAEETQPLELADVAAESEVDEEAYAPLVLSEEAPVDEIEAEEYLEATVADEPVAEAPPEYEPVSEATYDYSPAPVEPVAEDEPVEAAEEPLELGAEFEVSEVEEVEAEVQPEPVEAEEYVPAEAIEEEEVLESAETVETVEVVEAVETVEPAQDIAVADTAEPESLTGLLAAVRDLSEAARNTNDLSRRALYEAVGRAFDVSIKAVIASEHHARAPQDVIEHFPLDAVARQGPDMALVMVRRHANGETEVLGEVPHDSILMESAQRKLASQ